MNTLISTHHIATLLALLCAVSANAHAANPVTLPLSQVVDVPLGGGTTRLDYESYDPGRHLLFIAHLGDSSVIVFDTQAQRVVKRIPDISKVHGVLVIPELGRAMPQPPEPTKLSRSTRPV